MEEHHADIIKLEDNIRELHEMFNEVSDLVEFHV